MNVLEYQQLQGANRLSDNPYQPTLDDTTNFAVVGRNGVMVFAAGAVKFTTPLNITDTWTIPASPLPFLIPVAVARIWATGTTVANTNLRVLG